MKKKIDERGEEEIVKERITHLFELAKKNVKEKPERSKRYISLARKLAMRHRMSIPQRFKRSFCKKCNIYWIPGYNLKIKIDTKNKYIKYICQCGTVRKIGYK